MIVRHDMLIGPREKAAEAIRAGNTEEALSYLDQAYEQFRGVHDFYVDYVNDLLARLAEARGTEWYESYERNRWAARMRARYPVWKNLSAEELVKAFVALHRPHYSEFHVEEDQEKFVLKVTACNAGAKLLKDGNARQQNSLTREAYPWSANQAGFPFYCSHYHFYNEAMKELGLRAEIQWGRQYDEKGKPTGECCKYIAYK